MVVVFYFFLREKKNCLVLKFVNRSSKKNTFYELPVATTAASVVSLLFFIAYFRKHISKLAISKASLDTHCTANEMDENVNKMCDTI